MFFGAGATLLGLLFEPVGHVMGWAAYLGFVAAPSVKSKGGQQRISYHCRDVSKAIFVDIWINRSDLWYNGYSAFAGILCENATKRRLEWKT